MGKGPTVTLTFAGDDKSLKSTIRSVEASTTGLSENIGKLGKGFAVLGAASFAAPAASAGVFAGALAGVPFLFGAIGIAAAAQSEKVKSSFTSLKDHVTKQVTTMAAPLIPVLTGIADMAKATFDKIAPTLGQTFVLVGPMITKLAAGVSQFVTGTMPGLVAALASSRPVIDAISAGIANMGPAISQFFTIVSGQAPAATGFITGFFSVVNWLIPALGSALAWMIQWQGVLVPLGASLLGLSVLIKGVQMATALYQGTLAIIRGATLAWAGVQWVLNAALSANPIGIVVVVLATLVAAVVVAYRNCETFRNVVNAVWAGIQTAFSAGVAFARGALNWFASLPGLFRGWFNGALSAVTGFASNLLGRIRALPGQILGALSSLGSLLVNSGRSLIEGLWRGIQGAIGWVKDKIGGALSAIRNLFPFSPAKEGPFSGSGYTTHSGLALMSDFAQGITSGTPGVQAALANAFDPFAGLGSSVTWGSVSSGTWDQLLAAGWKGRAGDGREALYRPPSSGNGGGGAMTMRIAGSADSALVSLLHELQRRGELEFVRA